MALDFGSLVPETTEAPKGTRANNPTIPWVIASYTEEAWKRVAVPANQAREIVTLLNAAAEEVDRGIRIRVVVSGEDYVPNTEFWKKLESAGTRQVHVKYFAKSRSRRPRNKTQITPES